MQTTLNFGMSLWLNLFFFCLCYLLKNLFWISLTTFWKGFHHFNFSHTKSYNFYHNVFIGRFCIQFSDVYLLGSIVQHAFQLIHAAHLIFRIWLVFSLVFSLFQIKHQQNPRTECYGFVYVISLIKWIWCVCFLAEEVLTRSSYEI